MKSRRVHTHDHEGVLQKFLKEKLERVSQVLAHDPINHEKLAELTQGLHASELSQIIQFLHEDSRKDFVLWLRPHAEVFLFLDEHLRVELIQLFSDHEIAMILEEMESDDALSVLADMDEKRQERVLEALPKELRESLEKSLHYPEETAGRLMQREVLALPQGWTIKRCLEHIASDEDIPTNFHDVFVVDSDHCPIGVVSLSKFLKSPKKMTLGEVMTPSVRVVPVAWTEKEVAFLFRSYDLMSAPVVDHSGRLVGMITVDDVMDVIERQTEEDIMHMGGITTPDFYIPVLRTSLSRIQWLLVTLINTLLASFVIVQFRETLEKMVALSILMTIVTSMGGNAGTQVVTVTIRALATRELSAINLFRSALKEIIVAVMNGLTCAVLLGIICFVWFHDPTLAVVLGGGVIFNMVWAGIIGIFLPVIISRLGFDPALSAGPLINASTDIVGFSAFLGLAKLCLNL